MNPIPAADPQKDDSPATTPMGVQVLSFLCGLVLAVMGFKSAFEDFRHIRKLTNLDAFEATSGKFLEVKVRRDSSGSEEEWYPDVLYEYFVDGKSIWGWRLSYEEEPKPKTYWEGRLAGYAKDGTARVYYNPADPKDSILEKKHESLSRFAMRIGLAGLFLIAGLVLAGLPAWSWIGKGMVRK